MTNPIGGGSSQHTSRYRAVAEFNDLIIAANKAKLALRQLREEEKKLNDESIAGDKKVAESKQKRAEEEKKAIDSAKKATADLNKENVAGKAGESAGIEYSRGLNKGIKEDQQRSNSGGSSFLMAGAANAMKAAFGKAGEESAKSFHRGIKESNTQQGPQTANVLSEAIKKVRDSYQKMGDEAGSRFQLGIRERFKRDSNGIVKSVGFDYSLREFVRQSGIAGEESGQAFVTGAGRRIERLNKILRDVGIPELDLGVSTKEAVSDLKDLEKELNELSNKTVSPEVRIDANRALIDIRAIQRLLKDEVADEAIKETERIRKELAKLDSVPSGKAFKFWALTALSDMAKVYQEAEKGTTVFERLRKSISGSGGNGNFLGGLITGFDDFSDSTSKLLQRLGRVSGELYRMPGLIAALVSAIPALIAGLGALGGGALAFANGLGAASGLLVALPGLAAAGVSAVGALSVSFDTLKDVLKEAKKAQAEELYEKEKLRLGTDKALTPLQKYTALINDLLPATQTSTLAIVEFADGWTLLSERVGEQFFEEVVGQVGALPKILDIAENYLGRTATALGKVADEGIRMITSGPWQRDFAVIAENNAEYVENFGMAGLSLAKSFKDIAIAAAPFNSWLTAAIKEGAETFSDWAANARQDGTIEDFLGETQKSLQSVWSIFKNLGNVVNSFFQSTVDEGQDYLRTLDDITAHWADVAKAQEAANSPLREWMTNIRPVLSALGALVADLSRGIGDLASNQNNIGSMIALLDSLRTDVLPPILKILQQLNDSGIAVTITEAIGSMLDAIATFLDSGAATALSVFVTVLSSFFELIFNIASLPGLSDVLGGLAAGIAAIAAVSVVARFTGLFKLWDFFTWMIRNKGNLSGAFADAARGVVGLPSTGQTALPSAIPSSIGAVGSETTTRQATAINNVGNAAGNATGKVTAFSRAMSTLRTAGSGVQNSLSNLTGFLGGPWGIAITAATIASTVLFSALSDQKQEAKDTANALLILRDAYADLQSGNTSTVAGLANSNEKVKELIETSKQYGVSVTDVAGALNNQEQSTARFNDQINSQIAALEKSLATRKANTSGIDLGTLSLEKQVEAAKAYRDSIINTAKEQENQNKILNEGTSAARTFEQRLGGMTRAQVDAGVQITDIDNKIQLLSSALDTLADSTSTSADRSKALSDIIEYEKGPLISANEATENWNQSLLDLTETLETNGNSLSQKTREGLRNRDALQAAAKATRELYLEDIASGVPADEAIKRHQKRIKELEKEADKTLANKKEVRNLINTYGDLPESIKTDIIADKSGFSEVYLELLRLQTMQNALREGKTFDEAQKDWRRAQGGLYQRYVPGKTGDGPGFATGGAVYGAGTKTSDSIRAWLSNGEFVQPADSVDYYGLPLMEAIRKKKLDKATIFEALPDSNNVSFASGGSVHSDGCMSCQSGGHKFAQGGQIRVPMIVNPDKTKIDKDWVNAGVGDLGSGGGGRGWQWQMNVLRQQFPGLPLWSGFRPGSRTLSGNQSYHSVGRAVDVPPRRDVAQWIRANYGAQTKELITPFNDLNLHNGKPHRYTGAIWNQHNFAGGNAHDHWAFNQGGLVDLMKMMNMNTLAPEQNNSLPTTPRSLSAAASSVINNSTDNNRTFGDVIINNPMPERAGDSIRDALYRTTLLY